MSLFLLNRSSSSSLSLSALSVARSAGFFTGSRSWFTGVRSQSTAASAESSTTVSIPAPRGKLDLRYGKFRSRWILITGECKDAASFLNMIGRNCSEFAPKLTWDQLMTSTTKSLEELGVDAKRRKYILRWIYYYKKGVQPWHIEKPVKPPRGPNWRY